MPDDSPETYPIHVSESGGTYIKGEELEAFRDGILAVTNTEAIMSHERFKKYDA